MIAMVKFLIGIIYFIASLFCILFGGLCFFLSSSTEWLSFLIAIPRDNLYLLPFSMMLCGLCVFGYLCFKIVEFSKEFNSRLESTECFNRYKAETKTKEEINTLLQMCWKEAYIKGRKATTDIGKDNCNFQI